MANITTNHYQPFTSCNSAGQRGLSQESSSANHSREPTGQSVNPSTPAPTLSTAKSLPDWEDNSGLPILMEAKGYWDKMDVFRRDRARNKRYTYGDQWKDLITVDGRQMSEEDYILSQGNIPLKNNLIRRLVSNVLGVWRRQYQSPSCKSVKEDIAPLSNNTNPAPGKVNPDDTISNNTGQNLTPEIEREVVVMNRILDHIANLNLLEELYSRSMEEFLISGLVVHRKWFGSRRDKLDCHTDIVPNDNFFIDSNMSDLRGFDCSFIGQVHDIAIRDLMEWFATTPADCKKLREIYSRTHSVGSLSLQRAKFGFTADDNSDFLLTPDSGRCRVIEVWKKESRPRYRCHDWATGQLFKIEAVEYPRIVEEENDRRIRLARKVGQPPEEVALIASKWILDSTWFYYYLTPLGNILDSGETPYLHRSHPFVYKAYPFVDGEIHSFVSDVIDQQRYTNRLITMYDWIMRSSAKGLLLFPENCLPDGMSIDDIAEQWSRYNGIVLFKAKAGVPIPQQITNNATNIGITELLNLQLKFFEDISGVNSALQGKLGFAGQSAALFSQQTENATTSLLDLLASFNGFIREATAMDISNISRFYTPERTRALTGLCIDLSSTKLTPR